MDETTPGRFSVILKWLFCAFVISLAIFQLSENIAEPGDAGQDAAVRIDP